MNGGGRARRRGFTLVEMMVAIVVGSISILVAVQVAQVILRQSAKGRQRTDFSSRTRLLSQQLKADIRAAGVGSTGAIAVSNGDALLGPMAAVTPAGYRAIPAISGLNNVGGIAVGADVIQASSDVVQIVVPNPETIQLTAERDPRGTATLTFDSAAVALGFAGCPILYVSDHSAPTGAGRTHLVTRTGAIGPQVTLGAPLDFTVAPGSDVMCARVSTYWVDTNGWLHRSDLAPGAGVVTPVAGSPVRIGLGAGPTTRMAPGFRDLQVSYRVSAEAFRANATPLPATVDAQWAFGTTASPVSGFLSGNPLTWFEVRLVRVNLLARTLRKIQDNTTVAPVRVVEDSVQVTDARLSHVFDWVTSTEVAMNLRYFDMAAPQDLDAEPY